jgi:hypothetical protein
MFAIICVHFLAKPLILKSRGISFFATVPLKRTAMAENDALLRGQYAEQ